MLLFYRAARRTPHSLAWLLLFLLMVALTVLGSDATTVQRVPRAPGLDKVLHGVVFGAAGALAWLAQRRPRALPTMAGLAVLAVLDETRQALLPFRSFDVWDIAADIAAVVLVVLVASRLERRLAA